MTASARYVSIWKTFGAVVDLGAVGSAAPRARSPRAARSWDTCENRVVDGMQDMHGRWRAKDGTA